MTDKDFQLDEIEWVAKEGSSMMGIHCELFQPGEVYYEMRRENQKLFCNTGEGCSVCGSVPVVNVSGSYWLCGGCVAEKIEDPEQLAKLLNEREQECEELGRDLKEAEKEIKFLSSDS